MTIKTKSSAIDILVNSRNIFIHRFKNISYLMTPKTRFFRGLNKKYTLKGGAIFLDIGCHSGNTIVLAEKMVQGCSFIGFDIDDYSAYLPQNAIFHQVDVLNDLFPLEDNSVDIITIVHLIEHIADHKNLFEECRRILKPSGCMYIETPGIRRIFLPSLKIGLKNKKFRNQAVNFFDDSTHINLWTIRKLIYTVQDFGFYPQNFGVCRNIVLALLSPLLVTGGLLFRHRTFLSQGIQNLIGANIYCVVRK